MAQNPPNGRDYVKFKIRMDREHRSFTSFAQEELLTDLAEVIGCTREDIIVSAVRRGCVVITGKMGRAEFSRLMELVLLLEKESESNAPPPNSHLSSEGERQKD